MKSGNQPLSFEIQSVSPFPQVVDATNLESPPEPSKRESIDLYTSYSGEIKNPKDEKREKGDTQHTYLRVEEERG
jgi:hypothetical protein